MRKSTLGLLAGFVFTMAIPAHAEVSFDSETGIGFVGRADVKKIFGGDAVTPEGAEDVSFSVRVTLYYSTLCKLRGSNPEVTQTVERRRARVTEVISSVRLNPRKNVVTGFELSGYGEEKVAGAYCPKGWMPVATPVFLRATRSVLRTTYDDVTARLWIEQPDIAAGPSR
jgi:hypothetical protein